MLETLPLCIYTNQKGEINEKDFVNFVITKLTLTMRLLFNLTH